MLDELEHEDLDVDEPMMVGSDDEFDDTEDVYLEDVGEDDDNDSNSATPPHHAPSDTPNSSSNSPPPLLILYPQPGHHPFIYLTCGSYG